MAARSSNSCFHRGGHRMRLRGRFTAVSLPFLPVRIHIAPKTPPECPWTANPLVRHSLSGRFHLRRRRESIPTCALLSLKLDSAQTVCRWLFFRFRAAKSSRMAYHLRLWPTLLACLVARYPTGRTLRILSTVFYSNT